MAFTVDIRGNASHLEKTIGLAKNKLGDLANSAKFGVTALAGLGAAGAAGLGAFVISSSKAAASVEDLTIQLGVLTGSTAIAKKMIAEFKAEEIKSSLNLSDYADAAKLLLGFGAAQETVLPLLKQIGDVSLGNSERFGRLALAFGQIQSKGKLAGQELNQLAESGFNPLQIMVEKTGKTYGELFEMMEKRTITVDHVSKALEIATSEGGRFYKAIEKGSVGTTAKIAQTQAAFTSLQVAFGTGFNVGLKNALDASNTFLPQLTEKFKQSGEFIGAAITDSMAGNSDKFATLGTAAGELIVAGLQASVIAGLDNLGTLLGKGLAYLVENQSLIGIVAPEQGKKVGAAIRDFTSSGTTFREQLDSAMAKPNVTGALEKVNIESQITRGIKTGIDSTMSEAVKKGILEAWNRQPTGAKFTN
jgi:tape measure domain-containing protein